MARIKFDIISDGVSPLILRTVELYRSDGRPLNSGRIDGKFKSSTITPEHNVLLQNFPNPFNPETWIPYQLGKDANVLVSVYASSGQLVRTLNMGFKPSGFYIDRKRAAYWDGKDESGEKVASGIYFYTIQAGEYIATRKMLMLK